jgi:ribosome-binding protein aMBF1 (putative translation factor)
MITMARLSELPTADEVREQDMSDLDYRREAERTRLANDVAIRVIRYRAERGLSQAALARKLGMRQPNVARLESGDHEPSLTTLALLSSVLGEDFTVIVKPDRMGLRSAGRRSGTSADERKRA